MKVHQAEFKVTTMCRVLRVSRSGYYNWLRRKPSRRARRDRALLKTIVKIHWDSRGTYGAPRIQAELRHRGHRIGNVRIARLMARAGICGVSRRGKVKTTRADGSAVAEDLVNRNFQATAPNQLWVADATYIPTLEGKFYLAIILDVFSRRIVGWAMSRRQRSELMVRALQMAVNHRRPQGGLIHHSDRGSQYTSTRFRAVCDAANITLSMGSVGDCYDNAMAESFFASLETELIDRQPRRRFGSRREAEQKILEYLEGFYNRRRLHSALQYRSPVEFEMHYNKLKEVSI